MGLISVAFRVGFGFMLGIMVCLEIPIVVAAIGDALVQAFQ